MQHGAQIDIQDKNANMWNTALESQYASARS